MPGTPFDAPSVNSTMIRSPDCVPVGTYRIAFELQGFSTFVRDDLRLPVGFAARVDVVMKVGGLEETVTVSGQSPVIDATSTSTTVHFTTETLNEIPRGQDLSMI